MNVDEVLKIHEVASTPVRREMLSIFQSNSKPIDAQIILSTLNKKGSPVNKTTVFRNLNTFVEKNILIQLEFGEGKFRYELATLPHHHHIVCRSCGTMKDVEAKDLPIDERLLENKTHFKVESHKIEFFGLCQQCQ